MGARARAGPGRGRKMLAKRTIKSRARGRGRGRPAASAAPIPLRQAPPRPAPACRPRCALGVAGPGSPLLSAGSAVRRAPGAGLSAPTPTLTYGRPGTGSAHRGGGARGRAWGGSRDKLDCPLSPQPLQTERQAGAECVLVRQVGVEVSASGVGPAVPSLLGRWVPRLIPSAEPRAPCGRQRVLAVGKLARVWGLRCAPEWGRPPGPKVGGSGPAKVAAWAHRSPAHPPTPCTEVASRARTGACGFSR